MTNLSIEERRAIISLKEKQNTLIIKKADKGSTITIVKRERYIGDGEIHLSDVSAYQKLNEDHTDKRANRARQFVIQIHEMGYIDDVEFLYLLPPDPVKTQSIYFPYKIHKDPISVRPVVSDTNIKISGLLFQTISP